MRAYAALPLAGALMLGACGQGGEPSPEPSDTPTIAANPTPIVPAPTLPAPGTAKLPAQVADYPMLQSKDCAEVARFYLDALAAGEFDKAALVWNDPVVDAARLEAVLSGYAKPQVEAGKPVVEGAAGSLYCTVPGSLTDASDLAKPPVEGELVLRRANDVPGATPDQLRWTLQSSTFVEKLERSGRS